ncbi:MAG: hypothetical protein ACOCRX_07210 [Candidatus Woesearchaeota archaeon]
MKKFKSCKKGHKFSEVTKLKKCPFCKTSLEINYDNSNFVQKINDLKQKKSTRSEILNSMPHVPWFSDIENNNPDQIRSREKWEEFEIQKLKSFYKKVGLSNPKEWKKIAEENFQRSIYSLEHYLRIVIAEIEINI